MRRHGGFTIVEALVALVVLSIGMLGIASLYVTSLKANRNALIRSQAVNLVNDMADRIRANPRARGAYDMAAYGGAPAKHSCVVTSNCVAADLAEDDLAWWLASVTSPATGLTGANVTGNVVYAAAAATGLPDTYTITTQWTDAGDKTATSATPPTLSYSAILQMIPLSP